MRFPAPVRGGLLSVVPALLLCLVAVVHLQLTRLAGMAPWKGGGFGMFSTTDSGTSRKIGIRVSTGDQDRLIPLSSELGGGFYPAAILPTKGRLRQLARQVASVESRGAAVTRVHIAVWRVTYDPVSLTPRQDLVRDVIVDFPLSTANE